MEISMHTFNEWLQEQNDRPNLHWLNGILEQIKNQLQTATMWAGSDPTNAAAALEKAMNDQKSVEIELRKLPMINPNFKYIIMNSWKGRNFLNTMGQETIGLLRNGDPRGQQNLEQIAREYDRFLDLYSQNNELKKLG